MTITAIERTARMAIAQATPAADAIQRVTRISADPVLLGIAAGHALGRSTANPLFHSAGDEVAALLVRAGADEEVLRATAEETAQRLRRYLSRG